MKAWVTTKYGPPEVLQIEERDKPTLKENQVLIKNHVTTVSIGDVKMRGLLDISAVEKVLARLFLGIRKPKKDILGMECAGEIVEIGSAVTKYKIGDRVFASTFWEGLGGYAEFKAMNEDGMMGIIPESMSYEQAVPVLGGGTTAAKILKKANIQPGQAVLIYGASGNVGTYAVQIAKSFGAVVTGVCSTNNMDWVRDLGCDTVIDYTKEDFTQNGETYDVVFDAVSKMQPSQRKVSLKETGIFLDVDKDSGGVGKSKDHIEYRDFLLELMEVGKLKSVIDRTYTFDQIPEAHEYVVTGRKKGCVVVNVLAA